MFRIQKEETIVDVQKRLAHIVNHLISLRKIFEREELNIKILKCLDRSWQTKVTSISESKDLTTLTKTSLFGKVREHKLEMNSLNDQEHEEKHVRNIALKATGYKDCQESSEDNDGETLNLLTKNKNQSSNRYNNKKLNDFNANNYTCFGCGKQSHIKADCPNTESKERRPSKKFEKKGKTKRTYIAWQNNDVSSSSSSSNGDEEANLCLMAKGESDASSVSSNTLINF